MEHVTYEGVANEENPKPITFSTEEFTCGPSVGREGMRIYRLRNGNWERHCPEILEVLGPAYASAERYTIEVGADYSENAFKTLWPGDTWTHQSTDDCAGTYSYLPDDARDGEQFKILRKGAVLDWWDWGTREDHRNTLVIKSWFIGGNVLEPSDNDGRPELIVPVSNEVIVTYVDKKSGKQTK